MIGLIIFSIICFVIIWFVIFKIVLIYQKKNLFKNIPDKLEKQNKRFFNDGREVNFKELLGKESEKEEVVEEVNEEPKETITNTEPQPEPKQTETVKETVKEQIKKPVKKLPTFEGDKFKLPELEG